MGLIQDVRALLFVRQILNEAKKEIIVDNQVAVGWKTSEFWMHLLAYVPTIAAIFLPSTAPLMLGISAFAHLGAAAYGFNRSSVKVAALAPDGISLLESVADALKKAAASAQVPAPATPAAPAPVPAAQIPAAPAQRTS